MASGILTFNGLDSDTDLSLLPVSIGGMLGAPARALGLLDLPQAPGGIDPGLVPSEAARTLTIEGLIKATSQTTLMTTLDRIKEVCGTGLVTIAGPYATDRRYYGVLQPLDAEQVERTLLNGWARVTLAFVCPLPYAIASTPTTVSFGSTATAIPLGTAPSALRTDWSAVITITGAATTPIVTYADYRGTTQATLSFSGYSPSAGDSIVIDCGRKLVYRFVGGAKSNAFSYLAAGYAFPALSPDDAYVTGALWPTLAVSSGVASLRYYKAYR